MAKSSPNLSVSNVLTRPDRLPLRRGLAAVVALWVVLVMTGLTWLSTYGNTPGVQADAANRWPRQSTLKPSGTMSTLVMFVHPRCPCSRASLRELEVIMAQQHATLQTIVVFIRPREFDQNWVEQGLWRHANAIPGVSVVVDPLGREAERFGVSTSGQVLLYDKRGGLQFRGGITPSRGHSGDNLGRQAVVARTRQPAQYQPETSGVSVFGCPLFNASD